MSLLLIVFPKEIQIKVTDYLWGATLDWKRKLDITHTLPVNGAHRLVDVASYTAHNKMIDSEDCLYCGRCGEKSLFFALSYYMDTCLDCDAIMRTSNV